jgi:hypothetical protein
VNPVTYLAWRWHTEVKALAEASGETGLQLPSMPMDASRPAATA